VTLLPSMAELMVHGTDAFSLGQLQGNAVAMIMAIMSVDFNLFMVFLMVSWLSMVEVLWTEATASSLQAGDQVFVSFT